MLVKASEVRIGDTLDVGTMQMKVQQIRPVFQEIGIQDRDQQFPDEDAPEEEPEYLPFKVKTAKACREERRTFGKRMVGVTLVFGRFTHRTIGIGQMVEVYRSEVAA